MMQCNFFNYLFLKPFVSERLSYPYADYFSPKKQQLKAIGIDKRGHRKRLLIEIEKLPQVEIPQEVPVSHFTHLHVTRFLGMEDVTPLPLPPPPPKKKKMFALVVFTLIYEQQIGIKGGTIEKNGKFPFTRYVPVVEVLDKDIRLDKDLAGTETWFNHKSYNHIYLIVVEVWTHPRHNQAAFLVFFFYLWSGKCRRLVIWAGSWWVLGELYSEWIHRAKNARRSKNNEQGNTERDLQNHQTRALR